MHRNNKIYIYRFNESFRNPCYLLNFQDVSILLDCPIDLNVLQNFLPKHALLEDGASNLPPMLKSEELINNISGYSYFNSNFKVGFLQQTELNDLIISTIDAVLISNSTTLLGLPFLTEKKSFKGKVFATEPTIQFAKIMMMDIISHLKSLPKNTKLCDSMDLLKQDGNTAFYSSDMWSWYDIYTEDAVQSCLSRIRRASFNEPLNLFGVLEARGICSGYSIGSCNWLISSKYEKISYISHSSGLVSHAAPLDTSAFKDVDIMIIGTAVQTLAAPIEKLCDELCGKICDTIKAGGNVLVPITCCGLFFDLIEKISSELLQRRLERTQMFILSNQAKTSLAYANVYGEWLDRQRENQLYTADYPFMFDKLIKSNVLIPCDDISGEFSEKYRSPSIVFASHPSLRMGPVVHLLRLWGSNPLNGLFLVDVENYSTSSSRKEKLERVLSCYKPLSLDVHYYPLDTGINVNEILAMIEQMSFPTKALVLPTECMRNKILMKGTESVKKLELRTDKFLQIQLPDNNGTMEHILINGAIADQLRPIVIDDDTGLAIFNGKLSRKDGQFEIVPSPPTAAATSAAPSCPSKSRLLFGNLDPNQLIEELKLRSLTDAKLELVEDGKRYLIYFNDEDSLIQLNENSTHVVCQNEEMRKKIQDALVACFSILSV